MKTDHKLAYTLKEMMASVPLDDISVIEICRKCEIDRKTFYYHFHNIYDLLSLVYLDEKIEKIDECKNVTSMLTCLFNYYTKNSKFIDATISSAGKDLFQEFIYNATYKCLLRFVNYYKEAKELNISSKKSIARFFSNGYSHCFIYYLMTYKNKSINGLLNQFNFLNENSIANAINEALTKKGNLKS